MGGPLSLLHIILQRDCKKKIRKLEFIGTTQYQYERKKRMVGGGNQNQIKPFGIIPQNKQ
jgi:hypothetical protein